MNAKLLLCFAVVLGGVLSGSSQNYQTNETERIENNREILRLATLIDSNKPPVTEEMLETAEFDGNIFEITIQGEPAYFQNKSPENSQAILLRLLKYSLPPESRKTFTNLPPGLWIGQEDWVREKAAEDLVAMASPAVVPVLREWLRQGLAAAEAGQPCRWGEIAHAAKGLGKFHDATIVPLLVRAWQDGVFEKKMDTLSLLGDMGDMDMAPLPEIVITTLVKMPSPISKNILLEAMDDKRFDETVRYSIAAALVRLDDQSARELLLDGLDKYLAPDQDTMESSRYYPAFYELQHLGDAKLISAIEAESVTATRKRLQLVLPYLVERMRINNLTVDELIEVATEKKNLNRRLPAIEVLGETGGPDVLPFLESLTNAPVKHLGGSQNNLFAGIVKAAIRNVRLHNWEQLEKKP